MSLLVIFLLFPKTHNQSTVMEFSDAQKKNHYRKAQVSFDFLVSRYVKTEDCTSTTTSTTSTTPKVPASPSITPSKDQQQNKEKEGEAENKNEENEVTEEEEGRSGNRRLCSSIIPELSEVKYTREAQLFHQNFDIPSNNLLIDHFSCVLGEAVGIFFLFFFFLFFFFSFFSQILLNISGQGRIYLSQKYLCYFCPEGNFHSSSMKVTPLFETQGYLFFTHIPFSIKVQIPVKSITNISKVSEWRGVDSQLKVSVGEQSFLFRRFVNRRDQCFRLLTHLWEIQQGTTPIFGSFLPEVFLCCPFGVINSVVTD